MYFVAMGRKGNKAESRFGGRRRMSSKALNIRISCEVKEAGPRRCYRLSYSPRLFRIFPDLTSSVRWVECPVIRNTWLPEALCCRFIAISVWVLAHVTFQANPSTHGHLSKHATPSVTELQPLAPGARLGVGDCAPTQQRCRGGAAGDAVKNVNLTGVATSLQACGRPRGPGYHEAEALLPPIPFRPRSKNTAIQTSPCC